MIVVKLESKENTVNYKPVLLFNECNKEREYAVMHTTSERTEY